MAFQKVVIRPGVNTDFTPTLNEGGWSFSNLIRFKDGLAQKLGGWQALTPTPLVGTVRGLHAWDDLSGNAYLMAGSEQRLELFTGGQIYDITPIRQTDNVTPSFSTTSTSTSVKVTDAGHGANAGDWVDIVTSVSVGGLILQGLYLIQTVIDANNYTITAASAATSLVNNGGAVPSFTTINTQANVTVTFANHGFASNSLFNVQISTTVGGITIFGTYVVQSVTNANVFVITPGAAATSGATASENGGNVQFQYLISSGFASATAQTGYGVGLYGQGLYGGGTGVTLVALRAWYLDNFGQTGIANYNGSTLYQWTPPVTLYAGGVAASNPAIPVSNAPQVMNVSFVSNPQQMVIALGASIGATATQDLNLVRWSDAGVITTWTAAASNQAGSYRIPTGSRIVGGLVAPNQVLIWTDIDLWSMQYEGLPFVWGFNKVAGGAGLVSGRAVGVLGSSTYWMGPDNFWMAGPGGVTILKCSVWSKVFNNIYPQQSDKVFCAVNSLFEEVVFYFPSATGTGEVDSYVKFNAIETAWDCGSLPRTAWYDESVFGQPIGTDANSVLQQHDVPGVTDAAGGSMSESIQTGYFDLGDGEAWIFVERMIPDFVMSGPAPQLLLTVFLLEYPNDANSGAGPAVYGPYTITNMTQNVIVRGRGRQASLLIQGVGVGTFWRIGAVRHNGQPDGRR